MAVIRLGARDLVFPRLTPRQLMAIRDMTAGYEKFTLAQQLDAYVRIALVCFGGAYPDLTGEWLHHHLDLHKVNALCSEVRRQNDVAVLLVREHKIGMDDPVPAVSIQ